MTKRHGTARRAVSSLVWVTLPNGKTSQVRRGSAEHRAARRCVVTRHRVFVYGSLLAGLPNDRHLVGARLLGAATMSGLTLHDYAPGAYPAAVDGVGDVTGEVYEVDDVGLARLDRLEGHPRFYRRVPRAAELAHGPELLVWVYLMGNAGREGLGEPIASGDWRAHLAAYCRRPGVAL